MPEGFFSTHGNLTSNVGETCVRGPWKCWWQLVAAVTACAGAAGCGTLMAAPEVLQLATRHTLIIARLQVSWKCVLTLPTILQFCDFFGLCAFFITKGRA